MLQCETCGRTLKLGQTVYHEPTFPGPELFCCRDCFREHVKKNLADYIEIIENEVLETKEVTEEDFG